MNDAPAGGRVSAHLVGLLRRQAEEHGLVVWFDPGGEYRDFAAALAARLPDVAVEMLDEAAGRGSLLDLRRRVEPHLSPVQPNGAWRERPGRVVVYVPVPVQQVGDALIDLTSCGVVMAPDKERPRKTKLSVVARAALVNVLPAARVDSLARQAEQGELSLAELDMLAELDGALDAGRLTLLYGVAGLHEIALAFLADASLDTELVERGLLGDVARIVTQAFGPEAVGQAGATEPIELRRKLARFVLLTELTGALGKALPSSLQGVPVAAGDAARKTARDLARAWRNRLDWRESYARIAGEVTRDLHLEAALFASVPIATLTRTQTFQESELALQAAVERALISGAEPGLIPDEAERRANGFWSNATPVIGQRWRLIADAGRLLMLAETIRRTLQRRKFDAQTLIEAYADGLPLRDGVQGDPWHCLDTWHRRLLRRYYEYSYELDEQPETEGLRQLVTSTRQTYGGAVADLAEAFADALFSSRFAVSGVLAQPEIFARVVRPRLEGGQRLALIIVDALRYEMAGELADGLPPDWQVELRPALGAFPSITPVGMAALMPGAERGIALLARTGRRSPVLGVEVGGAPVETRQLRMDLLHQALPAGSVECKLEALTPASEPMRRKLEKTPVVVVTSQEIDQLGHTDNAAFARQYMDAVLGELRKAIATIGSCGFERVIVVADHGYLFGDPASAGEKVERPGGDTIDVHRRVWIGRGGSAIPGVLRLQASEIGLGGDLELATPRSLAVFEVGGSTDYLHGGVSPQELVVPVLELTRVASAARGRKPVASALAWEVVPGSRTISTRFFSATVRAATNELLPIEPPRVRVELRLDIPGRHVVSPALAEYGFDPATEEIQLRVDASIEGGRTVEPNRVTFHIADDLTDNGADGTAAIAVIEATTGRVLHTSDAIPVRINM